MNKKKMMLAWSSGKDSALTLYDLLKNKENNVRLFATITKDYNRISMHGVRRELVEMQAKSLGLPINFFYINKNTTEEEYEELMGKKLVEYKKDGIDAFAFGDIFLEDLRKHREEKLSLVGMKAVFPIWKKNTKKLAEDFIKSGFKAIIACVDSKYLGREFCGREFDEEFISDLPKGVDPCGENGEFHTFVYDGPIFKKKINFKKGKVVLREKRFYFCDLIPA